MENLIGEFFQARNTALQNKKIESEKGQLSWGVYGYGLEAYNKTFNNVLDSKIEDLNKNAQPFYCLEAFGEGQYIRDLMKISPNITKGMSLTLEDLRSSDQKMFDEENGIKMVNGDLFSGRTWKRVKETQGSLKVDGFNLIVCRPLAGWRIKGKDYMEKSHEAPLELKYLVVNSLWESLSKEEGTMLVAMSTFKEEDNQKINSWCIKLKEKSINAVLEMGKTGGLLKLTKNKESVDKLPPID